MSKVFIGVRVDDYLYNEIEKEAIEKGISKSDVIRTWLAVGYLLTRSKVKISVDELLYSIAPRIMEKLFGPKE